MLPSLATYIEENGAHTILVKIHVFSTAQKYSKMLDDRFQVSIVSLELIQPQLLYLLVYRKYWELIA
jgi:hypothetical protein